jgi:hypothetical protein
MAFMLTNPYAGYSGRQALRSGYGEFGYWGAPEATIEHYMTAGPGGDWNSIPAQVPKAEFAPYLSQQNWSAGPDSYGTDWVMDYDALNAAMNAKVAADRARYNTMDAWSDSSLHRLGDAPNYAGQLARALNMTPQALDDWYAAQGLRYNPSFTNDDRYISNPFVFQSQALDRLIGANNLGSNPEVMNWRNSLEGPLTSGGEAYVSIAGDDDETGWEGISRAIKGAIFAIGTPLTLGTALTGIPAATALGGGLGADILSAISNPAGSMGLTGLPASVVNTGIKQGIGSLLETDGSRAVRLQAPSFSGAVTNAEAPTEAVSTLAQDVTSPATDYAPQSLSNQVMTINKPRRPQIRLTEGFRRGQ